MAGETLDSLPHVVRLLDDEDPRVRDSLKQYFASCEGNLSHELSSRGIALSDESRSHLARLLAPARRRRIREEWLVPARGLDSHDGDWDTFEVLLRLISDLLHDGSTLRPTLPDAVDQLADEVVLRDAHHTEEDLCGYLFGSGRFRPNSHSYYDRTNSDLVWVLTHHRGNPLGLTILAMLVARRLDLHIFGCNFPGHFLGWIGYDGETQLVDCYHRGRLIPIADLHSNRQALSAEAQRAVEGPCSLGSIIQRVLANLRLSLSQGGETENLGLVEELASSLSDES